MRHWVKLVCVVGAALVLPAVVEARVSSARLGLPCAWQVVSTPNRNPSRMNNALFDVAVISSNDAWAIGLADVPEEGGRHRTTILHWDGSRWSAVTHPRHGAHQFLAISGDASDDVWIVGIAPGTSGLAMRWDGASWQVVPMADPGSRFWHFNGVLALAPDDVWAVGNRAGPGGVGALIEHWDGAAWSVVDNPAATRPASLEDVAALSPDDLWAVGETGSRPHGRSATRGLLEHWDGSAWHVVPGPFPPSASHQRSGWLFGVAPVSANDVWAVGSSNPRPGQYGGTGNRQLIEHWDGTSWRVVPAAAQRRPGILYDAVASVSFGVWDVGQMRPFVSSAITERWDGSAWTIVASVPERSTSFLSAIAAGADGDLWAVGGIGWRHQRNLAMRCV